MSKMVSKRKQLVKFRKRDISNLNYGVVHSLKGFNDGVSIVMNQVEEVMVEYMKIPKSSIFYLVGKAKTESPFIRQSDLLWHGHPVNRLMLIHFRKGFGGRISEKVEAAIAEAKEEVKRFIEDKKIDVLIVHNSSHPVNFISSLAISRYYRDSIKKGARTPKYILWWHDSHLERKRFENPAHDVRRYLLEGVPGRYVEYIMFINSLQFDSASKYFIELDKKHKDYYSKILYNQDIAYNTVAPSIDSYSGLEKSEFNDLAQMFLHEFGISAILKRRKLDISDVQFCLQHTRIVPRKRIDFALKYAYELFDSLRKKNMKKAMVFFVSGHHGDEPGNYKLKLINLNKRLSEQYKTNLFFLIFAEDFKDRKISFEKIPYIFTKLEGISTYFSEIEGFGNNLLEVLSSGLIPIVYTYPVFIKDIAKHKFQVIPLSSFDITPQSIEQAVRVIKSGTMRRKWANKNINILKKRFSHRIVSSKLKRAIIRERIHI